MASQGRKKLSAPRDKKAARAESGKPAREAKAKPAAVPPTGWRLWVFRLVAAVGIPVLVLLVAEMGLRLVAYGYDPSAIIETRIDGKTYACDNSRFAWRFFPKHLAREASPYIFPEPKPDNACRIFVLGASAAMGVPEPMFTAQLAMMTTLSTIVPAGICELLRQSQM